MCVYVSLFAPAPHTSIITKRNIARNGRGHMIYENGDCFIGFYQNDLKVRMGMGDHPTRHNCCSDSSFFFLLVLLLQEGHGVYKYYDGRVYEGNYHRDEANDKAGRMTWLNGTVFVGEFVCGNRTGGGKIVYPFSNVTYEGEFGTYPCRGRVQKKETCGDTSQTHTHPCHFFVLFCVCQSMESIMDMVDVSIKMAVFILENGSPEL